MKRTAEEKEVLRWASRGLRLGRDGQSILSHRAAHQQLMWRDRNLCMLCLYLPSVGPELPRVVQEDKVFGVVGYHDPALLGGEQQLLLVACMSRCRDCVVTALSRRLVRVLGPIIQLFVLSVLDAPQDLALRCAVAGKFVRDDHTLHILAALEQFAEELCPEGTRCGFVASALDQNIQHVSMLVNRSPQVGRFALDSQENFIKVPFVACLRLSAT